MANLIKIKRSLTSSSPGSLANGELAYTANGDVLFIGSNSTIVPIAGKRTPGILSANQALVANSSGYLDYVKTANAWISTLNANGSIGTAGQVLVSNGSTIYWGTGTTGSNTQIQFNDSGVANASAAFTFDKSTNTLSVSNTINTGAIVVGNSSTTSYITVTGTTVTGNLIFNNSNLTVNGTTFFINSNTNFVGRVGSNFLPTVNNSFDIGSSSWYWRNGWFGTSVQIGNSNISDANGTIATNNINIGTNLTVNNIIGTMTNISSNISVTSTRIYANNAALSVQTANVSGSLYVGTDLYVGGNVISQNVSTLNVADAFIYLAGNNVTSDVIDTGWISHYNNGANAHAGLFRHAATDQFYLFHNWPYAPYYATTIDIANSAFQLTTLNAYLVSAGLVSNATNVTITANSTLAVGITANTLTLSSPLVGTSGGTGLNTYTNQDILVANGTNGFNKLSLGTNGYLLQSNGSALIYSSIDGGTF